MPKQPKILPLDPSHIPLVHAIEQETHLSPWSEQTIRQSFGARNYNYGVFLKRSGYDELVGYCFTDLVAGELSIENICITTIHQSKGFARKLMQHVLEEAIRLNAFELLLEVRATNIPAIHLYKGFNFVECGVRKDYYANPNNNQKDDALIMKLVVDQIG